MIRSFLRSMARLLAAVLLLLLIVCAVEIALRASRLQDQLQRTTTAQESDITAPDEACYIDVRPMLDLKINVDSEHSFQINTNDFGLRNSIVRVPKPRGLFRILCLGSDSVFGTSVDNTDTVTSHLQRLLSQYSQGDVEVLNGGCPGAGPLVHLLRLRHHLLVLQPDLVVLCLSPQDLDSDQVVQSSLRLDDADTPAFAIHPSLATQGNQLIDGLCTEFVLANLALQCGTNFMGINPAGQESGAVTERLNNVSPVLEMHRLVSATFGTMAVSIAPSAWTTHPDDGTSGNSPDIALESALESALADAQLQDSIPVDNAALVFRRFSDKRKLFQLETGHLSPDGNELYARTLARLIITRGPGNWVKPDQLQSTQRSGNGPSEQLTPDRNRISNSAPAPIAPRREEQTILR